MTLDFNFLDPFVVSAPVYDIAFALGASGPSRSSVFDLQKNIVEQIVNFPSRSERNYGLIQYGQTANIRSRFEQFQKDQSFLKTLKELTLPSLDISDLSSALNVAPDLFQSSAPAANKILVLFTNSPLPSDVSTLETAARDLNRRNVRVVIVNTGARTDQFNWLPDPSYVIYADPSKQAQRVTVYEIGSMVYRGKYLNYTMVLFLLSHSFVSFASDEFCLFFSG